MKLSIDQIVAPKSPEANKNLNDLMTQNSSNNAASIFDTLKANVNKSNELFDKIHNLRFPNENKSDNHKRISEEDIDELEKVWNEREAIKRILAKVHIDLGKITTEDENPNAHGYSEESLQEYVDREMEEIQKAEEEKVKKDLGIETDNNEEQPKESNDPLQQLRNELDSLTRQLAPEINQTPINLD